MEERGREGHRFRRRVESASHTNIGGLDGADHERNAERADGDAELE